MDLIEKKMNMIFCFLLLICFIERTEQGYDFWISIFLNWQDVSCLQFVSP